MRFSSFRSLVFRLYSYTDDGVTSDVYVKRTVSVSNSGLPPPNTSYTGSGNVTRCDSPVLRSITRTCGSPDSRSLTTAWPLYTLTPPIITSGL